MYQIPHGSAVEASATLSGEGDIQQPTRTRRLTALVGRFHMSNLPATPSISTWSCGTEVSHSTRKLAPAPTVATPPLIVTCGLATNYPSASHTRTAVTAAFAPVPRPALANAWPCGTPTMS